MAVGCSARRGADSRGGSRGGAFEFRARVAPTPTAIPAAAAARSVAFIFGGGKKKGRRKPAGHRDGGQPLAVAWLSTFSFAPELKREILADRSCFLVKRRNWRWP